MNLKLGINIKELNRLLHNGTDPSHKEIKKSLSDPRLKK